MGRNHRINHDRYRIRGVSGLEGDGMKLLEMNTADLSLTELLSVRDYLERRLALVNVSCGARDRFLVRLDEVISRIAEKGA